MRSGRMGVNTAHRVFHPGVGVCGVLVDTPMGFKISYGRCGVSDAELKEWFRRARGNPEYELVASTHQLEVDGMEFTLVVNKLLKKAAVFLGPHDISKMLNEETCQKMARRVNEMFDN